MLYTLIISINFCSAVLAFFIQNQFKPVEIYNFAPRTNNQNGVGERFLT